jgi:hypothetical protein
MQLFVVFVQQRKRNPLKVRLILFVFDRIIFISEGEIVGVTGEDAGLMKSLTTPSVIPTLPQQHNEPATLIIDSTKPIYPRLQ